MSRLLKLIADSAAAALLVLIFTFGWLPTTVAAAFLLAHLLGTNLPLTLLSLFAMDAALAWSLWLVERRRPSTRPPQDAAVSLKRSRLAGLLRRAIRRAADAPSALDAMSAAVRSALRRRAFIVTLVLLCCAALFFGALFAFKRRLGLAAPPTRPALQQAEPKPARRPSPEQKRQTKPRPRATRPTRRKPGRG